MLSPANEYEVLQLLLGECRERLAAYAGAQHPHLSLSGNTLTCSLPPFCLGVYRPFRAIQHEM